MTSVWSAIEPLLWHVEKPARYIGGEFGAQTIHRTNTTVNWLLVYPDTYEIGLPNQGLQILYEILNERADATAERGYAPWSDFEKLMREHQVPFFSVRVLSEWAVTGPFCSTCFSTRLTYDLLSA